MFSTWEVWALASAYISLEETDRDDVRPGQTNRSPQLSTLFATSYPSSCSSFYLYSLPSYLAAAQPLKCRASTSTPPYHPCHIDTKRRISAQNTTSTLLMSSNGSAGTGHTWTTMSITNYSTRYSAIVRLSEDSSRVYIRRLKAGLVSIKISLSERGKCLWQTVGD